MTGRRWTACMIGGLLAAVVCVSGGYLRGAINQVTFAVLAASIANRLLIGFVVAVSHWRLNYLLHGAVIGLLVSLTASLRFLPDDRLTFVLYTCAGAAYGVMTEFLATVVFKSPARCASV